MLDEIRKKHNVSETFVSKDASVQTLIDRISPYGYLNEKDWIGVPLWVHRRCNDPMFSISNEVSYNNKMVQGKDNAVGCGQWMNIGGVSTDKYITEQVEKLIEFIKEKGYKRRYFCNKSIYKYCSKIKKRH